MKLTLIPNFNEYGVYVDDFDLKTASHAEVKSLKDELYKKYILVIFRNTNLPLDKYPEFISTIGTSSFGLRNILRPFNLTLRDMPSLMSDPYSKLPSDAVELFVHSMQQMASISNQHAAVIKLAGGSSESDSERFLEGDLSWHADESIDIAFCDSIALYGNNAMTKSATGFLSTVPWYNMQTESFRSELSEMLAIHEYKSDNFNDNLNTVEDQIVKCSTGYDTVLPLVVTSAGGHVGLHYTINTISGIKGMTKSDSGKLFEYINNTLFDEKYIYDHWYRQDNDLLLFDNSVTMHRRLGSTRNRVAFRAPFDFSDPTTTRYKQTEYQKQYENILKMFRR